MIQTIGRAARNVGGTVILYADGITDSMKRAMDETERRRTIQAAYNQEHGITQTFTQHPDHDLFGSLPGAGEKLAPRLLAEVGSVRAAYVDADALCCQAGVSPVSFQSGKLDKARIRWACDVVLRHTVHLWADCSRKKSAWAQAYYQGKRKEGHDHASALRCLGKRWLKILWRLWQNRQCYDETHHQQQQQKHGSWVSGLLHATPAIA